MTAGRVRVQLYVDPVRHRFGPQKIESLHSVLREMDTATERALPREPADLQLTREGCTVSERYKFTSTAFQQLASLVAPGMGKVLPDVCGMTPVMSVRDDMVDGLAALAFWNSVVDVRFPMLSRYYLLRNTRTRTVEGLLGASHQYLCNLDLFSLATGEFHAQRPDVVPYAAEVIGRQFMLWCRAAEPLFTETVDGRDWSVHAGYYLTNGEATGSAVRMTQAFFTPQGVCLGPYKNFGSRVSHTGRWFQRRLGESLAKLAAAPVDAGALQRGLRRMRDRSLGFTEDASREERKEYAERLATALRVRGTSRQIAREVVSRACAVGRFDAAVVQTHNVGKLYASRTLFDLFAALLWFARRLETYRRERLEQIAFAMLAGRFLS